MKIGIEIGGTFTDLILVQADLPPVQAKVPSTPDDPSRAAIEGVQTLLDKAGRTMDQVTEILHGSTIATNALIERKGAPTGLVTTRGFEDVLLIGRQEKTDIYDPFYRRPPPLVKRELIRGVGERLTAGGDCLEPLDESGLLSSVDEFIAKHSVTSVAIVFLHAYRNPAHEQRARTLLRDEHPELDVSISSDIAPEFREYERTATTVVNAYVRPLVRRYLRDLTGKLKAIGYRHRLMIMQSNGGILPVEAAAEQPVRMILSGPAAGVAGAISVVEKLAIRDVITMDAGGTSCDVALITSATPQMASKGLSEYRIDGNPINIRMLDISTIGAGGGSVVHIDPGGMLQVGPQSAGSMPGPACYGRGGSEFTVTDALLLSGLIDPERFVGGSMKIFPDQSLAAAESLCSRLGMTPIELARSVYKITASNMAQQIRRVTVERGRDPRQYAIMPYGGAGALFAATVADEIGADKVIVPSLPGIFSSYGLTVARMRLDAIKAVPGTLLASLKHASLEHEFELLEEELRTRYADFGVDPAGVLFSRHADVRYLGQGFELTVALQKHGDLPSYIADSFHSVHEDRYGHAFRSQQVELVNFRVDGILKTERLRLSTANVSRSYGSNGLPIKSENAPVSYERYEIAPGKEIAGPALIHEEASATYIPAGWTGSVNSSGALELVSHRLGER